jgi:signal transduction histidine kinase
MELLIEDLLQLARDGLPGPDSGDLVDLDDILLAEVRRQRLTGAGPAFDASAVSAGQVRGNRQQLGRMVRNLLDNARRHARGAVRVSLVERDGHVELAVDDDGEGIPPADRERIFQRFVRLEDSRGRQSGGSGLGLSIARSIAEGHGGSISLDAAYGQGARFVVRLPAVSSR